MRGQRFKGSPFWSACCVSTVLLALGDATAARAQQGVEIAPVDVTARQKPKPVARPARPVRQVRAAPARRAATRIIRPRTAPPIAAVAPPSTQIASGPGAPRSGQAGLGAATGSAERADGPVRGFVAQRSETGTKTDTPLVRTPQSIDVVTQDQIRTLGAQTPSEVLRYTPGVQAERFGADPRFDWIKVRGFDVPEYLDGLQLPKGTYAWPRYEPYGIERLEVLKGPASVLYGASPPGGLINFVSKKPLDVPYHEVVVQGGSYGRLQGAFDFTGPVDPEGRLLYRIVGLGRISDTIVDFVNDDRIFIAPSLTWRPDGATRFTVLAHVIKDDSKSLQFLPSQGTRFGNPYGRIARSTFLGEPGYDDFRRTEFGIGYEFEHHFDDAVAVRQNLRYAGVNVDLPVIRGFGFPAVNGRVTDYRNVTRRASRFDDNVNAFTVDNQLEIKGVSGPFAHTFLFGVDYRSFDVGLGTRAAALSPNFPIFTPTYGRTVIPVLPVTGRVAQNLEQVGIYAQDQIRFDRFTLLVSGRQDTAFNTTLNQVTRARTDQTDQALTERVGLIYNFDNGLAPYVSYATLFQPAVGVAASASTPTLGVTGLGAPFQPTTGDQIEGGVKYQPPGTTSLFTVSGFTINQQNVLVPDIANPGFQIQTGGVRVNGMEAEAKVSLYEGFDVIASYAYLDSEITRTTTLAQLGRQLPVTPHHQAAAFVQYTFQGGPLLGLSLGGGVRFFGDTFGDLANTLRIKSYTLFDATVRYDLARLDPRLAGAELGVSVNNIFDRTYVSTCGDLNTCYYGAPRTVLASLRYRW
jgi:iron complex outermembrane recepter protein